MWSEIKQNGILVQVIDKDRKLAFSVPDGIACLAAERLIDSMQWLHDEFMEEASAHPALFQTEDYNFQQRFVTHSTSRILSYVNHACVLEHIFLKVYKETIENLQLIDSSIVEDKDALNLRSVEMGDCFTFRNKVSAHTAYGSPRPEDNTAMEFHSLMTFLSSSYDETGKADSFALGKISVRLDGEAPSKTLHGIGLKDLHPRMLAHISAWTEMLINPCISVYSKLPFSLGNKQYLLQPKIPENPTSLQ